MIPAIVWQVPDSSTPAPAATFSPEVRGLLEETAAAYARLQTLSAQVTVRRARGSVVVATQTTLFLRRPDRLALVATTPGVETVRTLLGGRTRYQSRSSDPQNPQRASASGPDSLREALLIAEAFATPIVAELLAGKRTGEELTHRLLPNTIPETVTRTEVGDLAILTAPLPGREGERNDLRLVIDRTDHLIRQIVLSLARPDRPPIVVTEEWTRVQIDRPLPDRLFVVPASPKPRRR